MGSAFRLVAVLCFAACFADENQKPLSFTVNANGKELSLRDLLLNMNSIDEHLSLRSDCNNHISELYVNYHLPQCSMLFQGTSGQPGVNCPFSTGDTQLGFGACCSRDTDCASGVCDPVYRTCSSSCNANTANQCQIEPSLGRSNCQSNCRCGAGHLCSGTDFCRHCRAYTGPVDDQVLQSSRCSADAEPDNRSPHNDVFVSACHDGEQCLNKLAGAASALVQETCLDAWLQSQGLDRSCDVGREIWQFYLTWWSHGCASNNDGIICLKAFDDANWALRFSRSRDDECAALRVLGCCAGLMLQSLEAAGWQSDYAYWVYHFQQCNVAHSDICSYDKVDVSQPHNADGSPVDVDEDKSPGSKHKNLVIGLAVGVSVIGVIALVLAVVLYRRRYYAGHHRLPPPAEAPMVALPGGVAMGVPVDELPPVATSNAYNVTVAAVATGVAVDDRPPPTVPNHPEMPSDGGMSK